MENGEVQVEGYCHQLGYDVDEDGVYWYCLDYSTRARVLTLNTQDFNKICQLTYHNYTAFAVQDGYNSTPSHNWRCYGFLNN
jgi:hypothetical protein